jgi:mRNA interferase MazF
MIPRHGEVWLVDMGMAAKTRPAVVLIADNLNAPRSLIIHIPITRQNRGSELEVPLGHLSFLDAGFRGQRAGHWLAAVRPV